jgi:hypothetical protein
MNGYLARKLVVSKRNCDIATIYDGNSVKLNFSKR